MVDGHGKVATFANWPLRGLTSGRGVENDDGMYARYVDKHLLRVAAKLKTFGMSRQWNRAKLFLLLHVDHSDRAVTVADQDPIGSFIKADVVGIAAQVDPASRRIVGAAKQAHRPIARVSGIERIGRRHVAYALFRRDRRSCGLSCAP